MRQALAVICTCVVASWATTVAAAGTYNNQYRDPSCRPQSVLYLADESLSMLEVNFFIDGRTTPAATVAQELLVRFVEQAPRLHYRFGGFTLNVTAWASQRHFEEIVSWVPISPDAVDTVIKDIETLEYNHFGSWLDAALRKARVEVLARTFDESRVIVIVTDGDTAWWSQYETIPSVIRSALDREGIELIPIILSHENRFKSVGSELEPAPMQEGVTYVLRTISSFNHIIVGADPNWLGHELEKRLIELACSAY